MLTALPQRLHAENRPAFSAAPTDGEARDVGTEDAAVVQFETDQGALGTTIVSQISAGRKNRLWLEFDGAEEAIRFSQEDAETLWVGRREAATLIRRDPEHLSPPAARLATIPPGHPQGYADCFDLFVDDVYAADPRRGARRRPDVRRRPARRADHRRGHHVLARAALGRRAAASRGQP